jgi:hypothetical protein
MDSINTLLKNSEEKKELLYRTKYIEVSYTRLGFWSVNILTFDRSGNLHNGASVFLTVDEWNSLCDVEGLISMEMDKKEIKSKSSMEEQSKKALLHFWRWKGKTIEAVEGFHTEEHARKNALAHPAIEQEPEHLIICKKYVDAPSPGKFVYHSFACLLGKLAWRMSEETGKNIGDCFPEVEVNQSALRSMLSMYHVLMGLPLEGKVSTVWWEALGEFGSTERMVEEATKKLFNKENHTGALDQICNMLTDDAIDRFYPVAAPAAKKAKLEDMTAAEIVDQNPPSQPLIDLSSIASPPPTRVAPPNSLPTLLPTIDFSTDFFFPPN